MIQFPVLFGALPQRDQKRANISTDPKQISKQPSNNPAPINFSKAFKSAQIMFGKALNILITAGATKEPIDDVRYITNFSTGKLGKAFADEAASRGHKTVLIAPKEIERNAGKLADGVEHRVFKSTADLENELKKASAERQWDVVLHSAAVADYTPAEKVSGKISSSDHDELTIQLKKTPKLISSFRQWFDHTFLVGFKLLSGKSDEERYEAASKQLHKNRTNMCIENDLSNVSDGSHTVRMVTPEGGAIPVPAGSKQEVAKRVLDFIEKRQNVRWFKTVQDKSMAKQPESDKPAQLLDFVHRANLLPNKDGNISVKQSDGTVAMSPRGVDKSKLTADDFTVIRVDQRSRTTYTNNENKPSIDSSVADRLYKAFPELTATIHTHSPWVLGGAKTEFPYPCGVREEASEVIRAVKEGGYQKGDAFLVSMINHGHILGLTKDLSLEKLEQQWNAALEDYREHIAEVGDGASLEDTPTSKPTAIISPEGIIGTVWVHEDGSVSPRIHPDYQGRGYGNEIIKTLKEHNLKIATINACEVLEFYESKGFEKVDEQNGLMILAPKKPEYNGYKIS